MPLVSLSTGLRVVARRLMQSPVPTHSVDRCLWPSLSVVPGNSRRRRNRGLAKTRRACVEGAVTLQWAGPLSSLSRASLVYM